MKATVSILALLMFLCVASAQPTRTEIVNPAPTPAEDVKTNRDAVPDAYAINGQFDRVLIVRLKYKADLLAGLQEIIKQQKVKNAVILSSIGSVRGYHYHVVSNRTFPSKDTYVKDPTAPADIVAMNGYVIGGRVHAHITLADTDKAFGGHLESGTEVFTFAIVTIGVLKDGTDLSRVDDKTYR